MPTPLKKATTLPADQHLITGYMVPVNPHSTNATTSNDRVVNIITTPIQRRRRIDDDDDDDQPLAPPRSKGNVAATTDQPPVDGTSKLTAWPVPDSENESDANFAVILRPEQQLPLDLLGCEQGNTPPNATATRANARHAQRPKRSRRSPTPQPVSHVDPHPRIRIAKLTEF
jgi:hypothetical protein